MVHDKGATCMPSSVGELRKVTRLSRKKPTAFAIGFMCGDNLGYDELKFDSAQVLIQDSQLH